MILLIVLLPSLFIVVEHTFQKIYYFYKSRPVTSQNVLKQLIILILHINIMLLLF